MKTSCLPLALSVLALSGLAACSRSNEAARPGVAAEAPAVTAEPPTKTCALAISGDDAMKYDKTELNVAADCTEVTLTLIHTGKFPATTMGHNWVLTRAADMEAVATDGMKAGPGAGFVTAGDARVIAHTKVVGGGESTSVTFPTAALQKGGDYAFFCSFPGHWTMMKGKLVFA